MSKQLFLAVAMVAYLTGLASAQTLSAKCQNGIVEADPAGTTVLFREGNVSFRVYSGTQKVTHIASCGPNANGVVTVFDSGEAWYSKDCFKVGGGPPSIQAYPPNEQKVVSIQTFREGVVTTFSGGSAYYNADCKNIGSGNVSHD